MRRRYSIVTRQKRANASGTTSSRIVADERDRGCKCGDCQKCAMTHAIVPGRYAHLAKGELNAVRNHSEVGRAPLVERIARGENVMRKT